MKERLDYEPSEIWMFVDSEYERKLRLHSCKKEMETVAWIESLPAGSVLYDVGANVGPYSLIAASRGVKVHAFEPHPASFERLAENVALNQLPITCHQVLLHAREEGVRVDWSSPEAGSAEHTLGVEGNIVWAWSLDEYVSQHGLPAPRFLKVDVDGWEHNIFQGAREVLSYVSGILWEFDPRLPSSYQAFEFLLEQDFRFKTATPHGSGVVNVEMVRVLTDD